MKFLNTVGFFVIGILCAGSVFANCKDFTGKFVDPANSDQVFEIKQDQCKTVNIMDSPSLPLDGSKVPYTGSNIMVMADFVSTKFDGDDLVETQFAKTIDGEKTSAEMRFHLNGENSLILTLTSYLGPEGDLAQPFVVNVTLNRVK